MTVARIGPVSVSAALTERKEMPAGTYYLPSGLRDGNVSPEDIDSNGLVSIKFRPEQGSLAESDNFEEASKDDAGYSSFRFRREMWKKKRLMARLNR